MTGTDPSATADGDARSSADAAWPALLARGPGFIVTIVTTFLLFVWVVFLAVDIFDVMTPSASAPAAWIRFFNDRPVEWLQWICLVCAIAACAYVAGHLSAAHRKAGAFFSLLALGLGLMLVEEAGDVREIIHNSLLLHTNETILGLSYETVSDIPFFAALAFLPIYALLRFGRYVWTGTRTRRYLIAAYGTYALVAVMNALREEIYSPLGSWIDGTLLGGRFPVPEGMSQERAHHFLMDGPIEESLELLGAMFMLCLAFAFVSDLTSDRVRPVSGVQAPGARPRMRKR